MTIPLTPSQTMTNSLPSSVIHPTAPSGASPFAHLPHELMVEVFLHLDPHTLYTSIRFLNSHWKLTVEAHIIPMLFNTQKWRVALRVNRRPRKDTIYGPPAEPPRARRIRVEATPGAWEDELQPTPQEDQDLPKIKQHIPLHFQQIDPSNNRFIFSSRDQWYALYELTQKSISTGDAAFRLEVDFGIVWRFDGDGQEELGHGNGSWGKLDAENGWLSKFYCSSYDLSPRKKPYRQVEDFSSPTAVLNTTKLARRRRLPAGPAPQPGTAAPLYWDDKHVEYLHLELTLGSEFFVRRSARANLLMRALEAEAARRDHNEDVVSPPDESADESGLSHALTSKVSLHRPAPLRSPVSGASPSGLLKPGAPLHLKSRDSPATPPRSALSGQGTVNMSPAEQLQMMARSKAAAKAASHRRHPASSSRASSRPGSRAPSQSNSLAPSRVASRAPSRAPSRGPTRPTSPTLQPAPGQEGLLNASSSMVATPAVPGTPVASPRDLPFFRASALALSTNSPYTREALSGYITPDPNAPLGLNRSRTNGTGTGPFGLPTNAFSLRGGGGAQPGGTPIAEFTGRLRRAGGFEPIDLTAIAKRGEAAGKDDEGEAEGKAQISVDGVAHAASVWRRGPDILDAQYREYRLARLIEPEEDTYQGDLEVTWAWSR